MPKKTLKFSKMHGLGNDFMVIDAVNQLVNITPALIRQWSNRHTGIGFDQCLLVAPSTHTQADFDYVIYNADGQLVAQCGNGARCVAKFIRDTALSNKAELVLNSQAGLMPVVWLDHNNYQVTLPVKQIKQLAVDFWWVDVGNPHALFFAEPNWAVLGQRVDQPANISVIKTIAPDAIAIQTQERGVGLTQACGSAAVAAALVAGLPAPVRVQMPGGEVLVTWDGPQPAQAQLIGPAAQVFMGEIAC